jgi:hypothetical protein
VPVYVLQPPCGDICDAIGADALTGRGRPDQHRGGRSKGQFVDAQLALGEVFTDPYNGIQIETTTLVQGNSFAVSATFPP